MEYQVINTEGEVLATFDNEDAALSWICYTQQWFASELFVSEFVVSAP